MSLVLTEKLSPKVIKITLNDPDNLNAMGEDMAKEFRQVVQGLKADSRNLRAIILTGAGRAFSAGGNLEMLEAKTKLSGEENRLRMLDFYHSFLGILSVGVPIIAAINGHAVGAGLCVAAACDIRIVGEGAKLGFTFPKLGLHPGMGATYFLPKVIGEASATELMITGRVIDPAEALRLGLVSKIVKVDEIISEAQKITAEISTCGPEAVRQLLETMRGGLSGLEKHLEREALCQGINYASPEFKEGVRAAIEKRAAGF